MMRLGVSEEEAVKAFYDMQQRANLAEIEAERTKEDNARLLAALEAMHGPPPGPNCTCVNCCDFKPCPGQALCGDRSDFDERLNEARMEARLRSQAIAGTQHWFYAPCSQCGAIEGMGLSSPRRGAVAVWCCICHHFGPAVDRLSDEGDREAVMGWNAEFSAAFVGCDALRNSRERWRDALDNLAHHMGVDPGCCEDGIPDKRAADVLWRCMEAWNQLAAQLERHREFIEKLRIDNWTEHDRAMVLLAETPADSLEALKREVQELTCAMVKGLLQADSLKDREDRFGIVSAIEALKREVRQKVLEEFRFAVFAGSEKIDLGPKGNPQVLCRSEAQAEHMRTLWAPAGYYERTDV